MRAHCCPLVLFALLASSIVVPAASQQNAVSAAEVADVIIVGAGIAGVAAARQLADALPGTQVVLLEARDRPGGRLHSVQTRAGAVDLGAMWIHETGPGNAVYDLALQQGANISRPQDYGSASVFLPDGSRANMISYVTVYGGFMSQVRGRITAMRAAANTTSSRNSHNSNSSTGAAPSPNSTAATTDVPLSDLYTQFVENNKARWRLEQLHLENLVMHTDFQTLLNANITQLSALRFGGAKTLPNVDVLLEPGFDSLVKNMLPGLDVRYNTTVASISQNDSGVTLTTANGTQFAAAHVLVTLPLGVLKAGSVAWSPPLPAAKQAAINSMGMGVLDKLVLVFAEDDVFWDKTSDFLAIAPPDWAGRWSVWLNYFKTWRVPVLVALNPADTAESLEQLSDAAVLAEAMQVLNLIYGNSSTSSNSTSNNSSGVASSSALPAPIEAYVTRWRADRFARGSYSYFATGNPLNITGWWLTMRAAPAAELVSSQLG